MKVKFSTEELKKRLSQLGAVVAKKAAQPVFGFVRLFAVAAGDKFSVGITGVDIDATLTVYFTTAETNEAVDVLLPFAKLVEIVNIRSEKEITISTDGTSATLKAGRFNATLKVHPLDSWPTLMERPESVTAVLGLPGFKEQIARVEFAVPDNDGKYTVSVAKLESDEQSLKLVATDGFRLAISSSPQNAGKFSLVVPKPALDYIKKLEGGTQLKISEGEAGFYFETDLEVLTVNRTSGEFPPYEKILPKTHVVAVTVADAKTLAEAVKSVRALADKETPVIVFSAAQAGTSLVLDAGSEEGGAEGGVFRNTAQDEIDASLEGAAPVKFALNASYFAPFIDQVSGPVVIKYTDGSKVIDFNAASGQYRFLQMPASIAAQA